MNARVDNKKIIFPSEMVSYQCLTDIQKMFSQKNVVIRVGAEMNKEETQLFVGVSDPQSIRAVCTDMPLKILSKQIIAKNFRTDKLENDEIRDFGAGGVFIQCTPSKEVSK